MNHDLIKFHHWLLSSTFKSKWFEDNIKLQIISLLSWVIYPEYRKQISLLNLLKQNKFILSVFSIFILWSCSFFTFGRLTSETEYKNIYIQKNIKIDDFMKGVDFESMKPERKYIEYLIHSKFKIEHYKNLQKLPDEIFFTIICEIKRHKIPASLFFRLLDQESGFLEVTNTSSGANGVPQLMKQTRCSILKIIGKTNHKQIDDIRVASYLLKTQYDEHRKKGFSENKSWCLSLMDYNGGSLRLAKNNLMYFSQNFN